LKGHSISRHCRQIRKEDLGEEYRRRLLALVAVLFLAGRGFLQGDQQNAALIVSGYPGQVPLTQIYGRPYVAASRGSHKGWFVWRVPHDAAASFWLDLSFQSI
jgi:hypothetical protein